ncbi:MAG TPA: DUF1778 domain-containing protein [Stellaceae bacterium]|nr:DUF1778 domain-containing protein [Stellaceae bacterium]
MTAATLKRHDVKRGAKPPERRSVSINLRATETWRALIDHAASMVQKTRSEFIIDATRRQAEDVLLDQRFFVLDEKRYRAFVGILDEPPMPNDELKKLMSQKAPWRKQ